jgi:hypothetical protein
MRNPADYPDYPPYSLRQYLKKCRVPGASEYARDWEKFIDGEVDKPPRPYSGLPLSARRIAREEHEGRWRESPRGKEWKEAQARWRRDREENLERWWAIYGGYFGR